MTSATMLQPCEVVRLDADRLERIYATMGSSAAEETLCRGMETMAVALRKLETDCHLGATDRIVTGCVGVGRLAHRMGMTQIERVSRDVARTAQAGETIALAATLARLVRLCERSFYALWDRDNATL